jgi:hypothetical protein
MGERRGAYRVLVGKPERSRPLGRPRLHMDWHGIEPSPQQWLTGDQPPGHDTVHPLNVTITVTLYSAVGLNKLLITACWQTGTSLS